MTTATVSRLQAMAATTGGVVTAATAAIYQSQLTEDCGPKNALVVGYPCALVGGEVLRCVRTLENMIVTGAPRQIETVPSACTIVVQRGVGSVMPTSLVEGDVLLCVGRAMHVGNARPGLGAPVVGADDPPLAIEPVLGWRAWRLPLVGDPARLSSVHQRTLWPHGEAMEATCGYDGEHPSPEPSCLCGIYLPKTLSKAMEAVTPDSDIVFGVAKGWGRCVEHETGWRVEKCYPAAFIAPERRRRSHGEQVLEPYGVPIRWSYGVPISLRDVTPDEYLRHVGVEP